MSQYARRIKAWIGQVKEAKRSQPLVHRLSVVLEGSAKHANFRLDPAARDRLGHAEVKKRHSSVGEHQEVARVWIAGELSEAIQRTEEEAEHDLADAVAGRLGRRLYPLEPHPVHPFGYEHTLAAQLAHNAFSHDGGADIHSSSFPTSLV